MSIFAEMMQAAIAQEEIGKMMCMQPVNNRLSKFSAVMAD